MKFNSNNKLSTVCNVLGSSNKAHFQQSNIGKDQNFQILYFPSSPQLHQQNRK